MTHDEIDAIARKCGALPDAVTDIKSRVLAKFTDSPADPAAVEQWLATLKGAAAHLFHQTPTQPWERLGIAQEVWNSLGPSTRLALARGQHPSPTTIKHNP